MLPADWPLRANPAQLLVSFAEPVLPEAQVRCTNSSPQQRVPQRRLFSLILASLEADRVVREGSASGL